MIKYLISMGYDVWGFDIKSGNNFPDVEGVHAIIHLGAISDTRERNWRKILELNTEYTISLMDFCANNKIKFQYASSASVYGNGNNFSEDAPFDPTNPYAVSKMLIDIHAEKMEYRTQGFRYFNVYGDGEKKKKESASPISKFMWQSKTGKIKIFKGSENFKRDFVCVEDVCKIHEKMLRNYHGGIYNIGCGEAVSFLDIAKAVSIKTGAEICEIDMPADMVGQYQSYTCADNTKLKILYPSFKWTKATDWINAKISN